jgi:hypothetical protein
MGFLFDIFEKFDRLNSSKDRGLIRQKRYNMMKKHILFSILIGCVLNGILAMDEVKQRLIQVNPFMHSIGGTRLLTAEASWCLHNMHPYPSGPRFKCDHKCAEETELLSLRTIAMETEFKEYVIELEKISEKRQEFFEEIIAFMPDEWRKKEFRQMSLADEVEHKKQLKFEAARFEYSFNRCLDRFRYEQNKKMMKHQLYLNDIQFLLQ